MGRKSKADSRRPEILEAAYKTLRTESLESASFAKIAKQASIAPSLITHYFNSKEELILALTDYLMDKYDEFLMQDFSQIADPEDRLKKIISTRLEEHTSSVVDDRVWYNLYALALRNKPVKKKLSQLYTKDREALTKQLKGCSSADVDDKELAVLARIITTAMEGLGYYAVLSDGTEDLPEETNRLKTMMFEEAKRVLKLD